MAWGEVLRAVLGIAIFVAIAWAASEQRRQFSLKPIGAGIAAQFILALVLTRIPAVTDFFGLIARGVDRIQVSSSTGASFVFGYLAGGPQPFSPTEGASSTVIFAFQVLPAMIFVSALAALLWHWGVLRRFVQGTAWVFGRLFGVTGPVGVSTSACIFMGMIEAPLLIRPLIPKLSRAELFIIMVQGMSVLAGSMMIVLGAMLAPRMPNAFSHLLIAALISTPMAIGLARSIIPGEPAQVREALKLENPYRSSLDALMHGALVAVKMAAHIAALLIVFVGLVALLNQILSVLPGETKFTVAHLLGYALSPVAWLMGVPQGDLQTIGSLLGTKVALNEVVAYGQLMEVPAGGLTEKGALIAIYLLASFGNIGSVAILMGALTAMAPDKATEIVPMGFRALLAAVITSCLTGTTIGILSSLIDGTG